MEGYLITFLSIIVGYIVTIFFAGWQSIISKSSLHNIYWLHIGWTLLSFAFIIYLWWKFRVYQKKITINFLSFLIILCPFFLLYLIGSALFPDPSLDISTLNFKNFFYEKATLFFLSYAGIIFLGINLSRYIFDEPFWGIKTLIRTLLLFLFIIASFWQNEIYQIIVFLASYYALIWFIHKYFD
jgi:hypothetical protein